MQVNIPHREQPGFRTPQPAGKEQPEELWHHQMPVRDFRAQAALICFRKETPEFFRGINMRHILLAGGIIILWEYPRADPDAVQVF